MCLTGSPVVQYVILEYLNNNWNFEHIDILYDNNATVALYKNSGWLSDGGPMAWLYCDQILTGEDRLAPCIKYLTEKFGEIPAKASTLQDGVRNYLIEQRRWDTIGPLLQ